MAAYEYIMHPFPAWYILHDATCVSKSVCFINLKLLLTCADLFAI